MRAWLFILLIIIADHCGAALNDDIIVVAEDGSVTVRCGNERPEGESCVFRFGLPQIPPAKLWREDEILRGLWVTNGILYTQTVVLTAAALEPAKPDGSDRLTSLLLVNIHGENTNSEYSEAVAELALEQESREQVLELNGGILWRLNGERRSFIGTLDIAESGIRNSHGAILKFAGSIPPSLKGSMTLKIPLVKIQAKEAIERLRDIEFDEELRKVTKPRKEPADTHGRPRLKFARELR